MENTKFNHLVIGIIIGLLAPTIGIIIFYFTKFESLTLGEFLKISVEEKMLSPLLSLCAVINLAVFYLLIQFDKLKTGRGIILATFIYGLAIVLLKFGIITL